MANMFNEDGTYNKTNWKAGDKITANKLNKIEESLEAINNNDISRHVEADTRLDALEEQAAGQNEVTNERMEELNDLVLDTKDEIDLALLQTNNRMNAMEEEFQESLDDIDSAITTSENMINNALNAMNNSITEANTSMQNQITQGKADMEAMVAEVEADLEGLHAKDEELAEQLTQKANVYLIPEESLEGNILIDKRNSVQLGCGTINLDSPIQYGKESKYHGSWWSYGGTRIIPTGDFSAFTPDTSQSIDYTRNEFSNFMLDGKNLSEDTPILKLNKSFLTTFEKIFFINGGAIDITQSDSIRFIDCRFMDGVDKNIKINIGNGARSINFIGCNFENYNGVSCIVNIDGGTQDNQMTTNINFTNCQTERASFKFDNCSNCVIDASKFHATSIVLGEFTNNIKVINVADSTSRIIDLGKDNIIENCVGENIAGFNISKYRLNSDFKATNNYYGEVNKEYFIITSIFPNSHNRVTRGKIQYALSNGTEIYRTSSYDLRTDMTTNGTGIRHSFTDMRVLKNPGGTLLIQSSADSGNSTVNKNVILKENLIQGGEFISSNVINELWEFKNVTGEIISEKLVATITSDGEYGIYQSISGLDENKCYMVVMNSDYNINVVVGDAWNGTQGARKCLGRNAKLTNGTYLSQVYLTNMKSVTLSIGGWNGVAGNEFNINYIALVEI